MDNQKTASMQFFMEMKKKYPELAENIIEDFISKYPDDIKKCQECLQEESDRMLYASVNENSRKPTGSIMQNLGEGSIHPNTSHFIPYISETRMPGNICGANAPESSVQNGMPTNKLPSANMYQGKFNYSQVPTGHSHQEIKSAPVMHNAHDPFSYEHPYPSQNVPPKIKHHPWSYTHLPGQKIYAGIKGRPRAEPKVSPSESESVNFPSRNSANSVSGTPPQMSHITRLNFNPSLPYLIDPPTPGRHRTSINVEVNPGDQQQCEISTYPHNSGASTCHGYDSHLKISLSPTSTSITARRIQKPATAMLQFPSNAQVPLSLSQWQPPHTSSPCIEPIVSNKSNFGMFPVWSNFHASGNQQSQWSYEIQAPEPLKESHRPPPVVFPNLSENDEGLLLTQVLLQNQRSRLEMLQDELNKEKLKQLKLEQEIKSMERKLKEQRQNIAFPNKDDINKLKEEQRKLQVECQCLSFDIDQFNSGEVPVGRRDDDFYKNIPTGQAGPIPPFCPSKKEGSFKSNDQNPGNSVTEEDEEKNKWECTKCTFQNHPALNKCEMCEMARSDPPYSED